MSGAGPGMFKKRRETKNIYYIYSPPEIYLIEVISHYPGQKANDYDIITK